MRISPFVVGLLVLTPFLDLSAQEEIKPTYVNVKTSSTTICLNEPIRIEFTTMPRNVDGVDVVAAVTNALRLGDGSQWQLLSGPTVIEIATPSRNPPPVTTTDPTKSTTVTVHERPKPITVTFTLLPRRVGDLQMPEIPITWLVGNQIAPLPTVVVQEGIKVGQNKQELPKEYYGVAGVAWNTKLADVKSHVADNLVHQVAGGVEIHLQPNLTLDFVGDAMSGATLVAPQLSFEQARVEFLKHWGIPQAETATTLTWYIGWTTIVAKFNPEIAGITITLVRDDLVANLTHSRVSNEVFSVLDGPLTETPEQAEKRRTKEAEAAIQRQVNGPTVNPPVQTPPASR